MQQTWGGKKEDFLFNNIAMKAKNFNKGEYFRFAPWHIDDGSSSMIII